MGKIKPRTFSGQYYQLSGEFWNNQGAGPKDHRRDYNSVWRLMLGSAREYRNRTLVTVRNPRLGIREVDLGNLVRLPFAEIIYEGNGDILVKYQIIKNHRLVGIDVFCISHGTVFRTRRKADDNSVFDPEAGKHVPFNSLGRQLDFILQREDMNVILEAASKGRILSGYEVTGRIDVDQTSTVHIPSALDRYGLTLKE